ncbi:MAG: hypothetical protein HC820_07270 [Hydrococcus sp. RM1_1_31]|nr:hypothetical protein [Hydrococcus sp. RM1_1_31]
MLLFNATEFVEVSGRVPGSLSPSLLVSAASAVDESLQQTLGLPPVPSGDAGNLTINTNQLRVTDGAQVTARNGEQAVRETSMSVLALFFSIMTVRSPQNWAAPLAEDE